MNSNQGSNACVKIGISCEIKQIQGKLRVILVTRAMILKSLHNLLFLFRKYFKGEVTYQIYIEN